MRGILNNGGCDDFPGPRVVISTIIDLTENKAPDSAKRGLDFGGIRIWDMVKLGGN